VNVQQNLAVIKWICYTFLTQQKARRKPIGENVPQQHSISQWKNKTIINLSAANAPNMLSMYVCIVQFNVPLNTV